MGHERPIISVTLVGIGFALAVFFLIRLSSEAQASPPWWADCSQALYVANEGNGGGGERIMRVDCNENIITFATGFNGPSGLVTDGTYLYISDDAPGLWRVDSAGVVTPIATAVAFSNPNGLALDSSGRLLVADAGAGEIRRLTLDTAGNVTANELVASGLNNPQGVVVKPSSGEILFTDSTGHVFSAPDSLSSWMTTTVGAIVPGNQGSLKMDSSGNIYTGNSGGRIMRIDPTGSTAKDVVDIPHAACPAGQAAMDGQPGFRGLTFSAEGHLVATGYCLDNVYIFSNTDLDNAWATNTPIATLPTPFAENPSGALDSPYLNGTFAVAFFGADVKPLAGACALPQERDNVIHVDVNSVAGTPDGSPANPHLTIQDAVDGASPGDIIIVKPGVYAENITISTSDIHLVGATAGAQAVIDASPSGLSGITIASGTHAVTIANFRFTQADNEGVGYGAGIIIYGSPDADLKPRNIDICNNIFVDNEAGVAAQNHSPRVVNNTFVDNSVAGITTAASSTAILRNNIFQDNSEGIRTDSTSVTIDYNLFYNNGAPFGGTATCAPSDGCMFNHDPLLTNVPGNDYHLTFGSPAIDIGTDVLAPAADFDFDSRPIDGDENTSSLTDIGADEFVPSSEYSCIIGIFEATNTHDWSLVWTDLVHPPAAGEAVLKVAASSVSPSETGTIIVNISDDAGPKSIEVVYPATGDTVGSLALDLTAGTIYPFTVETTGDANHYKLGSENTELAVGQMEVSYLEGLVQTWGVRAEADETVHLEITTDTDSMNTPPQATWVKVTVYDMATSALVYGPELRSLTLDTPEVFAFLNGPSATKFRVRITPDDGHFRMRKVGGDENFYTQTCPDQGESIVLIPGLSQWGLIGMAVMMAGAVLFARTRSRRARQPQV